jgi:pre-rRNA-processing protein TSR1
MLTNPTTPGRIPRQSPKKASVSSANAQSRLNRRNNAKQAQSKKRQVLVSATRIFNGTDGAPRIVAVIPLTEDVSPRSTVCALAESLEESSDDCPETGLWKLKYVSVVLPMCIALGID